MKFRNETERKFHLHVKTERNENFVLFHSFVLQKNKRARIESAKRSRVLLLAGKRAIGNVEQTKSKKAWKYWNERKETRNERIANPGENSHVRSACGSRRAEDFFDCDAPRPTSNGERLRHRRIYDASIIIMRRKCVENVEFFSRF